MTDAHCHVSCGEAGVRELLTGRDVFGTHPWRLTEYSEAALRRALAEHPRAGVGEIGLDRLREKEISAEMRAVFASQLNVAAACRRPVTLHGAKCWGQVVAAVKPFVGAEGIPACLFHGFSRSDGLIPEIVALNGYVSVGPAVLNDHAVNYRALVRKIPRERLLVETDRDSASAEALSVSVRDVVAGLAAVLEMSVGAVEALTDANAERFTRTTGGETWI